MKISFDSKGKANQPITIEGCDGLENGYYILSHTTTVDLQGISLKSLDQGEGMFANTTLSSDVLNEIATSIKEHKDTDVVSHEIDLGNININDDSIINQIEGKGWTVTCNIGKYATCTTVNDVTAIEPEYKTVDIIGGVWSESLSSLANGSSMFEGCSNLTTFTSDLSSLKNGGSMFQYCNFTTFDTDLSSLTNSAHMFVHCSNLETFTSDLSSLTKSTCMFQYCENLTTFESNLSSLIDGFHMFSLCVTLKSFNADLSSLIDGSGMFFSCRDLESFTQDLSSLIDGDSMFNGCKAITSFNSDLSSLISGERMFYGCGNLTTFESNLSSLTNGAYMFENCSKLRSFNLDLPSLTSGIDMFKGCQLSVDSIVRIANSLPVQFNSPEIHIGNLGESISSRITESCELMGMKGWTVKHGDDDKAYTNKRYIPSEKYNLCQNTVEVTKVNSNYRSDVINGFWIHPLQNLKDGESMFTSNPNLNVFKGDLGKLTSGFEMFYECTALSVFNGDLTTLTNGVAMFRNCASLTELNFDLGSMVDGYNMFNVDTASHISFQGNLSSLIQGHSMFMNRLRSFDGDLSSLEIGKDMFSGCCLDKKSVKKIASSIKELPAKILPENFSWTYPAEYDAAQNYNGGQSLWKDSWDDSNRGIITLGIDSRFEDDNELQDYLAQIRAKNWIVEVDYNDLDNYSKIKYIGCLNVSAIKDANKEANSDYSVDIDENGVWSEPLPDLEDGNSYNGGYQIGMFQQNTRLVSFNADLSSLTDGEKMFYNCSKLESFNSDLSSLEIGTQMFDNCKILTTFTSDLSYLTDGQQMFYVCSALESFTSDLQKLKDGSNMFYGCGNLESFSSDLSSLNKGEKMFYDCSKLKSFTSDGCGEEVNLNSLSNGKSMFENAGLISFNSDLKSLTDSMYMFKGCSSLETFSKKDGTPIDLKRLDYGRRMFEGCSNLKTVNCKLELLTDAGYMFSNCHSLTRFDADLSRLQYAGGMFEHSGIEIFSNEMRQVESAGHMFYCCTALTSFTSKLDNLKSAEYMFNDCSSLKLFYVDISNVTDGHYMFNGCTSLTSFVSDLQSLTNGMYMFKDCKLDEKSLQNISKTINDLKSKEKSGRIDIGLDESVSQSVYFECGNKLMDKGWKVYFNDALYEYTTVGSPNDVSEANGWCPNAYKSDTNNWNTNVYIPKNLTITEITSKGEMINNG